MNAIIIAAGSGKRISNDVRHTPKSLLKVNNKTLLDHQIEALTKVGIENITLIVGPYSEKFDSKNVEYVHDTNHEKHDILGSLMEAKDFLKNDVLVLYSDVIFEPQIIKQLLDSTANISIAVDSNWEIKYEGRTNHPKNEAENVEINNDGKIIKIKKNIQSKNNDVSEFLGIAKFSSLGIDIFVSKYQELLKNHTGNFHEAPSISKAYLTDMFQELIDSKNTIEPVFISGKWCEIDTKQDLETITLVFSYILDNFTILPILTILTTVTITRIVLTATIICTKIPQIIILLILVE